MKPKPDLFPTVLIFAVLVITIMVFFGTQFSVENAPNTHATAIIFGSAIFIILAIIRSMYEEPAKQKTKSRRKSNREN